MEANQPTPKPEESLDLAELDATGSVDDFIRQLEEKEKDLHITADLTIEIEESEFDPRNIPDDIVPENDKSPSTASQPAVPVGAKTRIYELEQEVEVLKKRLTILREERNEVQEKSDRRLKDFESYKYRMDRERRGAFIDQISNLASQMLPVFDNLDRALNSVKGIEKGADLQQFYDGIVLVNQQVAEIFQDMGVEPIKTTGESFDPNFHEAVAVEERDDVVSNTILEEMLRGFRIGNRVIRHSMVKVTTGPAPQKKSVTEDAAPAIPEPSESLPETAIDLPEISDSPNAEDA